MADKVSTLMLKVDLGCSRCYNKVKKILCKYGEKYHIQEEIFDEKQNTVIISGPFCPKKLTEKLCCKAGGAIKYIEIIEKKHPKPADPKPAPRPEPSIPPLPPPCYYGCGRLPPPCYCGCGRQAYVSPCCKYFNAEDPNLCSIM